MSIGFDRILEELLGRQHAIMEILIERGWTTDEDLERRRLQWQQAHEQDVERHTEILDLAAEAIEQVNRPIPDDRRVQALRTLLADKSPAEQDALIRQALGRSLGE